MPDPRRPDFGASLREARERAGITLRDISTRTKISTLALDALERSDLSRLPGGVFTRAFVRSYAREVGLDPEEALTRFLQQFPEVAGDAELHEANTEGLEREPRTGAARALRLLVWLLPILAGVAYFAFLRSGVDFTVSSPPSPQAASEAQPGQASGQAHESVATPQPAAMPTTSPADVAPAVAPPAVAPPESAGEARAEPLPVPEGAVRIALAPRGPCWLSLKADGETVFSGLMQAGERREFELRGEVSLTAGDAGALGLTLNGEAARPLGDAGRVVTIRFSRSTFRELLASR